MRILFVLRSINLISYYRSIIEELGRRGHEVIVFFDRKWSKKDRFNGAQILSEINSAYPRFSYKLVGSSRGLARAILVPLRELRSYRRYLLMKEQSDFYRRDWIGFLPKKIRLKLASRNSIANKIIRTAPVGFLLRLAEKFFPADAEIKKKLSEIRPEAVVVSPANMRHSSADAEYLKAAKGLGIPTAISVMSWDNLTVRGVIPIVPDCLLVWNKIQSEEAMKYHDIPESQIRIVGSPLFDPWFNKFVPSVSREEFSKIYDLRADNPYVVYLGSSVNIAKDETWLIKKLRQAMNDSDDRNVRMTQIVVRPHPSNYNIYEKLEDAGIVIIPKKGSLPATASARQVFFDTVFYSIGTAGVNTSGMIDALILDKPGAAIMTDQYRETQQESAHFRQFIESDCIEFAKSPEDLIEIIKKWLAGEDPKQTTRRDFIKNFIRPQERSVSAGAMAAEAIENLANGKF